MRKIIDYSNSTVIINTYTERNKMCVILRVEVGEYVDIRTIAKQVVIEKGGIAKAADLVQARILSTCRGRFNF